MPYLRRHYLPTLPPKEWAFSLNACHLEGKDRRLRWKSATCRTSAVRSVIALAISAKTGRWTEIGADVDGSIGLGTLADRSTSRLTVAISIIPCSMVHFFYVWDSDLLSRAQKIFIHCCQFGCWRFQGLTGLSVLLVQSGCISVLMFSVSSSIHASTSPLSSSSESKKSSQFQIWSSSLLEITINFEIKSEMPFMHCTGSSLFENSQGISVTQWSIKPPRESRWHISVSWRTAAQAVFFVRKSPAEVISKTTESSVDPSMQAWTDW